MAFITEHSVKEPSERPCPRWGELDDITHGRNYRVTDGFSRFRTSFDATHESPLESVGTALAGFQYPKPFEVEIRRRGSEPAPTRRTCRNRQLELFPTNDPLRMNDEGRYGLLESTRDSLDTVRGKLYRESHYQNFFPGEYHPTRHEERKSQDDHSIRSTEQSTNPSEPIKSQSMSSISDKNQNFNLLISTIYNYRLPAALHQPDDYLQESYLPLLQSLSLSPEMEKQKQCPLLVRPKVPEKLGAFMHSVKAEMDICEYDKTHQESVAETMTRTVPEPAYGEWENSSDQYKLKLADKAGTQKQHHESHSDDIPDLRDNRKYTKRVDFFGFNSSAFRG